MSQILPKQVKLNRVTRIGDLIVSNADGNGEVLEQGLENQVLTVGTSTIGYEFITQLRDADGDLALDVADITNPANTLQLAAGVAGSGPELSVQGETNADLLLTPAGNGEVLVPVGYTPVQDNALITKAYADSIATGLDVKDSVRVGTTANVDLGVSGIGTVVDGVTLSDGDRVLVKDQTNATENGIYVVGAGAWTRSDDADNTPSNEVSGGMFTFIEEGDTLRDTGWVLSSPDGNANLGTDNLEFTQFSRAGVFEAGQGMSRAGIVLDVNVDDVTTIIDGSNNVAVGHNDATDRTEQVLLGGDATLGFNKADWGYVENLRGAVSGNLIIDGVDNGADNYLEIGNAAAGNAPAISAAGADTNIDLVLNPKANGNLLLDGISWLNGGISANSLIVADGANSLEELFAPSFDGFLYYNSVSGDVEWLDANQIGGDDFGTVALGGNFTGGNIVADQPQDTFTLSGGDAINLDGDASADEITISLDFSNVATASTVDSNDEILISDSTNGVLKTTISDLFDSIPEAQEETTAGSAAAAPATLTLVGFFTAGAPLPETVEVYVNGLRVAQSSYNISGQDLELLPASLGYDIEAADEVYAQYRY